MALVSLMQEISCCREEPGEPRFSGAAARRVAPFHCDGRGFSGDHSQARSKAWAGSSSRMAQCAEPVIGWRSCALRAPARIKKPARQMPAGAVRRIAFRQVKALTEPCQARL